MERRTTKPEYGPHIAKALGNLGEASADGLLAAVYTLIEDILYVADHETLANGEQRWRNQAQHMLDGMIDDGYIIEKNGLLSLSDS
ncbi:hypothetical protein HOJ44_07225 [Candidatus Bathyarchaeota archaeon]|jgi:hypothetical protein|nr:hypothetical protein [Candidatus Bathyarchaeota archaeon]